MKLPSAEFIETIHGISLLAFLVSFHPFFSTESDT
jgi:hypothetical protein